MKNKLLGQVFTPSWIVKTILDQANYHGEHILEKYVLEPACGDGAFLCEIVSRYIQAAQKAHFSCQIIVQHLQKYIYGVELDEEAYQQCIHHLNQLVEQKLGKGIVISWQIHQANMLHEYSQYLQQFDYIFGNPPYIRIHHLDEPTRLFIKNHMRFSSGMIDIYVSFFEISFLMLKSNGVLGFITPNSFLYNASYQNFRQFLQNQKKLALLCDFQSHKIFDGFSTYTAITIFDLSQNKEAFSYQEKVDNQEAIKEVNKIKFSDLQSKKWTLTNQENQHFLNQIFANTNTGMKQWFDVQYGFATLRDKIFISKITDEQQDVVLFNQRPIEKDILRKIVKASRYKGDFDDLEYILFPYTQKNGRYAVIEEDELKERYPLAYAYLLDHKQELLKRDVEKGAKWYEFGRSQGLQSSHKEKVVISPMVGQEVNCFRLPEDVLVYSGMFLSAKRHHNDLKIAEDVLRSEAFLRYARLTGKDFSGGYKSLTPKQIKEFRFYSSESSELF